LWTDWFSPEHWQRERRIQGARNWAALYQQRPKPAEGALIKRDWVQRYQQAPAEFLRIIQSWDTAYKDTEINDPSVCTTWGETRQGWYVLDVFRDRMEYPALKRAVASKAEQWQPHAILIEDKSSGQSLIQEMRGNFAQPVIALEPEGSKLDRLVSCSSLYEAGLVFHPEHGPWLIDYESELFGYPLTTHDDQVDSTSQALNWMFSNRGNYKHISAGDTRAGLAGGHNNDQRHGGYGSIRGGNNFGGFF
jgi:predicted phage terminase large subunit-like protein